MKVAKLYAAAVEVHCPHCDEPVPNPHDGSLLWERAQVTGSQASIKKCASCSQEFAIAVPVRVNFV